MKAQYIGDVKDYGKYRFLNLLCESTGLKLGINWYLTNNDSTKQGNFGSIPDCLDYLYTQVTKLKKSNAAICDVEKSGLLSNDVVYYHELLSYSFFRNNKARRTIWHKAALDALSECDVIFLDPDTGLIANDYLDNLGKAKSNFFDHKVKRDGTRYVSIDEINDYLVAGKTLILFQYGQRTGIEPQLQSVYERLERYLHFNVARYTYIFRYSKSNADSISFICFVQDKHIDAMSNLYYLLMDDSQPWSEYYDLWEELLTRSIDPADSEYTNLNEMEEGGIPLNEGFYIKSENPKKSLYTLISQIPKGKVTTYGYLSTQIYGHKNGTQGVLSMIKSLTGTSLPCHRVVSSDGIPKAQDRNYGNTGMTHKDLLVNEGVVFIDSCTIDMAKCMCWPTD